MDVRAFDFNLPPELIAQQPASERTDARLLYLHRDSGAITHTSIRALTVLLQRGDLLVVNNTRVFPARLLGRRVPSGGAVECLLIGRPGSDWSQTSVRPQSDPEVWEALMHPGQKLRVGGQVVFEGPRTLHAEVLERRF